MILIIRFIQHFLKNTRRYLALHYIYMVHYYGTLHIVHYTWYSTLDALIQHYVATTHGAFHIVHYILYIICICSSKPHLSLRSIIAAGIFTCDGCARDPYFYVSAETQSYVIKLSCSRTVLAASGV